jgi:putative phosphoribosyl transferase
MDNQGQQASAETFQLGVKDTWLQADLVIPPHPVGLVIFAHGSGSSRLSRRNIAVARLLQASRFATLLFDLLTPIEDQVFNNRFDIELLTDRLLTAIEWAHSQPHLRELPITLFGASTGAAAAIQAAARSGKEISAVVSRGGRPDLAVNELENLKTPTLLIVGGRDEDVADLNRDALSKMHCEGTLVTIPGATHLFEEAGALEQVAQHAAEWFLKHLSYLPGDLQIH